MPDRGSTEASVATVDERIRHSAGAVIGPYKD
jgi:hypothetical protein